MSPTDRDVPTSRTGDALRWTRAFVDRHLFTLIAVGASVVIVGFVPQVRHLFPSVGDVLTSLSGFGLAVFVLVLAMSYVWLAFVWVIPKVTEEEQLDLIAQTTSEERFSAEAAVPQREVGKWIESPVRGADRLGRTGRRLWAAMAVAAGLLWYAVPLLFAPSSVGFFEEPIRVTFAILLLASGAWLFMKERISAFAWNMLGRTLVCLLVANLLGEIIWHMAPTWSLFSYRNYSLWAILHCVFCLLLLARVSDAWQFHSLFPVRVIIVVLCLVSAAMLRATVVGNPAKSAPTREAALETWLEQLEARLDEIPREGPVALVAASGGGSRAALFTSLVLEGLDREPITFKTADGQTSEYLVSDHMLLISSVSGGSLASAYCIKRFEEPAPRTWKARPQLLNSLKTDLFTHLPLEAERICTDPSQADQETLAECKALANRQPPPWWLESEYMDEMCTDFMAPLLRGGLHLRSERGLSVSQFWTRRFFSPKEAGAAWAPGVAPLLLLNACEIERGQRLVIGYPPAAPGVFPESSELSTTRALADVNPAHEISLAEGVRLSANFPWGFAVGEIPAPSERLRRVHVTDGGVIDNTGIGTISELMERLAALDHPCARDIVARLRHRARLLIEIDSGAKPSEPDWLERQFPEAFEPSQGMENSSYTNADRAKLHHKDVLEHFLLGTSESAVVGEEDRSAGAEAVADAAMARLYHVTLQCNHVQRGEGVMTAWALGPKDKASVLVRFIRSWKIAKATLATTLSNDAAQRDVRDSAVAALEASPEESRFVQQQLQQLGEQAKAVQQVLQWETIERKRKDLGLKESPRSPQMQQAPRKFGIENFSTGASQLRGEASRVAEQLKEGPGKGRIPATPAPPP